MKKKINFTKKITKIISNDIDMDIFKIINYESKFKNRQTKIKLNVKDIQKIINSGWDKHYADSKEWCELLNLPETTLSAVEHLKKILNNIRGEYLKCNLYKKGIGRAMYSGAISMCNMPRELRHALSVNHIFTEDKLYEQTDRLYDYDIDNAHNVILLNICIKSKINIKEYNLLQDYCLNRDKWLKDISENIYNSNNKDSREQSKKLMLIALNQGYLETDEINDTFIKVQKFQLQIKNIFKNYFKSCNEDFYKQCVKNKNNNKHAGFRSFVAKILQHLECYIVENVITKCEENKLINKNHFDYQYDGFQTEKKIDINTLINYSNELGYKLKWSIKKPTHAEKIWREVYECIEDSKEEMEHPDIYCDIFDDDYFKTLIGNFEKMKSYWEIFYTFVKNPEPCYYYSRIVSYNCSITNKIKKQRRITPYSEEIVKKQYKHIHCNIKKTRYGDKKIPFLDDYVVDLNKKTKEYMDFFPCNSNKPKSFDKKMYNTFTGYNEICFEPDIKFDPNSIKKGGILYSYLKVVENVVGGEKQKKLFLQLMADKIINPSIKRPFGIVITGKQGEGKNNILNVLSKIIGQHHYLSTANIKDITGDYAEGMMNKLIVNMNEIRFADTRDKRDTLKSLVSEGRARFNPKYCRPIDQNVYALIVITSNNPGCVPLDIKTGERRWIVFNGNSKNLSLKKASTDTKYKTKWAKLVALWDTDEFIRQLYLYLKKLVKDNPNYDFQKKQTENTQTPAYRKHAMYFVPDVALMLIDYIKAKKFIEYKIKDEDNPFPENNIHYSKEPEFKMLHTTTLNELTSFYKDWYKNSYGGNENFKPNNKRLKNNILSLNINSMESETGKNNLQDIKFIPIRVLLDFHNKNFFHDDISDWDTPEPLTEKIVDDDFDDL
tara:strand:- start:14416 stop:17085 length:2670 start_codon:yes stop_codon:yes gene_type:complete